MHSSSLQLFERGSYVQTSLNHVTPSVPPKRKSLSCQVTTEWLVRAGGERPWGDDTVPSFWLGSRTSHLLAADCSEFRSNATRSLKKKPST